MMPLIPKYTGSVINVSPVICCSAIFMGCVLFASCAQYSWPAILFWNVAGLIMLIRCDNICCDCLNQNSSLNEQLLPSVSGGSASAGTTTTIRMPRPPKGFITIPTHINAPRWHSESSEGEDLFNEDFNIRDFEEDGEGDENEEWTE